MKPRRIRMGKCPLCGNKTRIAPRDRKYGVGVTNCSECFHVFENSKVATWLEEPAGKGGV